MTVDIYCGGLKTYAIRLDAGFWVCSECGKRVKVVW